MENKKRILLFIDSNIKTIPYEVPLLELKKKGNNIIFLSILESGQIHEEYKKYDIEVFSMDEKTITLKHILKYLFFFIQFCKKQKVDVVFAHLSIPSFVSVLGQYFIKAKVFCFRHHFNFINLSAEKKYRQNNADAMLDKVNARLASKIILPSNTLIDLIQSNEGVPRTKMVVIPYAYNWSQFLEGSSSKAASINCDSPLKLLMISRLTKLKRPELAILLLASLHKNGIKSEVTIVGTGDKRQDLTELATSLGISRFVHFEGFQKDVAPYIINSDFLIHPSLTEASSSVVKEAGVLGLPVIVCDGVGDFNDYINNGNNGWLVDPDNFIIEAKIIIENTDYEKRSSIGKELKKTILNNFSVTESVVNSYMALIF